MKRFVVVAALVIAMPTAIASGDIGITGVSPTRARPGDRIRVTAGGYLGMTPQRYPIVMVKAHRAPLPRPCRRGAGLCTPALLPTALRRPPFVLVGLITRWQPPGAQHGRGTLTFRLPRVAPGLYLFGLFCASCTRGPKGSLIVGDDALRVVR